MRQFPPRRIVCLTEETVETLYLLGEQERIVGVSGYAVRPPQVRRDKPRVSAFTSGMRSRKFSSGVSPMSLPGRGCASDGQNLQSISERVSELLAEREKVRRLLAERKKSAKSIC